MEKKKQRRWIGKIGRWFGRLLYRIVALILICCLAGVILFGSTTGSLLLVDLVKEKGGSYYDEFLNKGKELAKRILSTGYAAMNTQNKELYLVTELQEMAQSQKETDALLLAELESGAYSLESPFILVNPYGISPMTALVMFQTEEPSRISIHVAGDTELAEVDYTFDGYNTDHMIPVYGLYAGRINEVTLTVRTQSGAQSVQQLEIETDALPDALSHETVRAHVLDADAYQPGFNFTYQGNNSGACKAAIDANGDYRWYLNTSGNGSLLYLTGYCGNYNEGNSVFISVGMREYGPVAILELNFLGKLLNAWYAPYGVHHDISPTQDGTLLVTGSAEGDVKETLVYEIDMDTGEIITTLDYTDVLQVYRNQTEDYPEITNFYKLDDWCHINTVLDYEGGLLISSRHQSTLVYSDREGNIEWMLGDPTDYYAYFQQYLLTPVGDDFEYFYIQHAPEILPDQDGDPDTLDILLFDNGDFRVDPSEMYSRMVQYRINTREMTVEQIWSYGEDRTELFSYRHGDADLLPNGNRIGSFEPYNMKTQVRLAYAVEVNEEGEEVWECWRSSDESSHEYSEYRIERLNIYADSANDLHLGEEAKLFLPEVEE